MHQAPEARQVVRPRCSPREGGRNREKAPKKNPSAGGAPPAGTINDLGGQRIGQYLRAMSDACRIQHQGNAAKSFRRNRKAAYGLTWAASAKRKAFLFAKSAACPTTSISLST